VLVLFMTLPGLAPFYGGLVRRKNVLSVMAQCFGCAGLVTILWWLVGYSFTFASGSPLTPSASTAWAERSARSSPGSWRHRTKEALDQLDHGEAGSHFDERGALAVEGAEIARGTSPRIALPSGAKR
jgi:hypothetical protein